MGDIIDEVKTTFVDEGEKSGYHLALMVYILQVISFFVIITAVMGIIVNYIKLDTVKGTWIESHFRWQMRTFWYGLLWSVIGGITALLLIGYVILFATFVWYIYRVIKGWLNLSEHKPMYVV